MPSDAERRPERSAFDWFGPIPSSPSDDPYRDDECALREVGDEDKNAVPFSLYSRFATASVDFITQFLDWSWFVAEWRGAPRWKWIVWVYVRLLLIGPAIALFGFLILGWYR